MEVNGSMNLRHVALKPQKNCNLMTPSPARSNQGNLVTAYLARRNQGNFINFHVDIYIRGLNEIWFTIYIRFPCVSRQL